MTDKLVTDKTASLAKELGFKWSTTYAFGSDGGYYNRDYIPHDFNSRGLLSAPTQWQLWDWVYLEHYLHVELRYIDEVLGFSVLITNVKTNTILSDNLSSLSRTKAMEIGLYESLKLIEDENK